MYAVVFLFLNMGTPELFLIGLVALLLFGGKRMPELAKGLGKGYREFKTASDEVKREIQRNVDVVREEATKTQLEIEEKLNKETKNLNDNLLS